jgi:hypothetical protein
MKTIASDSLLPSIQRHTSSSNDASVTPLTAMQIDPGQPVPEMVTKSLCIASLWMKSYMQIQAYVHSVQLMESNNYPGTSLSMLALALNSCGVLIVPCLIVGARIARARGHCSDPRFKGRVKVCS